MKKTKPILMLTAVFVVIFAAACSTPAAPATQAAAPAVQQPAQQQPAVVPADTQAVEQPAPTDVPATEAATLVFPDTIASETYCVQKIPYQNILMEQDATFKSLDTKGELQCKDSNTDVDGKNVITCTGKQLWTYELQITTAQGTGTMKVNIGACP